MTETKLCPACAEEIKLDARKCKHCGEWIEGVPPMSPPPSRADIVEGPVKPPVGVVVLLVLILGIGTLKLIGPLFATPPEKVPLTISPGIIPDVSTAPDIAPQTLPESARPALSESQQEALDAVTAAFDLDNKLGVRLDDLRVRDNPKGEGAIVYVEQTRFNGTERNLIWVAVGLEAFAMNSPSKMVTPPLPWPHEAKDGVWEKTGLDKFGGTSEVIEMVY